MHKIGEDISEALDVVPAILRVIATVRPKYACRSCENGVAQAPAPRRMIEGGMATTSLIVGLRPRLHQPILFKVTSTAFNPNSLTMPSFLVRP